jgi:hypothetical protein
MKWSLPTRLSPPSLAIYCACWQTWHSLGLRQNTKRKIRSDNLHNHDENDFDILIFINCQRIQFSTIEIFSFARYSLDVSMSVFTRFTEPLKNKMAKLIKLEK